MRSDADVTWVPVGKLGEVRMGKQLSPDSRTSGEQFPYLRVANVFDGHIDYSNVKTMGFTEAERKTYALHPGDILLNEGQSLELVGRSSIYNGGSGEFCFQNTLVRFRPGDGVLPGYAQVVFSHWLTTGVFAQIAKKTTSIAHLGGDRFAALPFPVLSLAEQRRIVEVLEAVSDHISAEEASLGKEESIWDGILDEQFSQHASRFQQAPLSKLAPRGGEYGSNEPAIERDSRLPRYVRITDINDEGELSSAPEKAVSIRKDVATPYLLSPGDLLIARTGFTTGKTYLYRREDGLCAFAGYLIRFRIDHTQMLPDYAFMWTRGSKFKSWVSQNIREVGQRNISAREFGKHEIPVPPLQVQKSLASAWHEARTAAHLRSQKIRQLKILKESLSADLLSAKVRVGEVA